MTSEPRDCPSVEVLARFLIEECEVPDTENHLSECANCRRQLEELAADSAVWCVAREYLHGLDDRGLNDRENSREALDSSLLRGILAPTDDPVMMGRIGAYEVCGVVGEGGTAIVFKAFDTRLNRYVAIKVLAPLLARKGSARKRFEREGKAIAAVADDHIIEVHAVGEHMGLPYIVMQYVAGSSLQHRIDKKGMLEVKEVVRIGLQVARALSATHRHGIIHRDIKPSNILLEDGVERARVGDFGLVQVADDATMTRSGCIAGTPQYMSPEQARGEAIDGRSDLFSLGVVMYAMCAGRPPFRASTALGAIRGVTGHNPVPVRQINPEIPPWLESFIHKLLEKNPADRFVSADNVASFLTEELAYLSQSSALPPARSWRTDTAGTNRPRTKSILLGLGSLAVGLCCFFAVFPRSGPPTPEPAPSRTDFKSLLSHWAANPHAAPGKSSVGTIFLEGRAVIEGIDTHVKAAIRMNPNTGEWRPSTSWASSILRLPNGSSDIVLPSSEGGVFEERQVQPQNATVTLQHGADLGTLIDVSEDEQRLLWIWNSNSGALMHRVSITDDQRGDNQLISSGSGHVEHACLSPNVDQVAFMRRRNGATTLHVSDVFTKHTEQLPTAKLGTIIPSVLSWSPNGRELAVAFVASQLPTNTPSVKASDPSENIRIAVCDLSFGYLRSVTPKNLQIRELESMTWSPQEWTPVPLSVVGDAPE